MRARRRAEARLVAIRPGAGRRRRGGHVRGRAIDAPRVVRPPDAARVNAGFTTSPPLAASTWILRLSRFLRSCGASTIASHVDFLDIDAYDGLAADWAWLEARANGSPFTTWAWVSTWLRCLPDGVRPIACRVRDGNGLLALGLMVQVRERPLQRLFGTHSLSLLETHDPQIDEITPEYIGLLVRRDREEAGYAAFFEAVVARCGNWRRIRFPATAHGDLIQRALPARLRAYCVADRPAYRIDLASIRASGKDYLQHLSKKTRANLAQVRRAYCALGELRVEEADDPALAVQWLAELRALHERRWTPRGQPGSFASAFFRAFHERLVREHAGSGFARLLRVSAGALVVGYLYVFQWRGGCYFYNSGFNYGALPRYDSPGIAALHAVVEHGFERGWEVFEFLAGDQDYKRRLSTDAARMHWIEVRPAGVRLALEGMVARLIARRSLGTPLAEALVA